MNNDTPPILELGSDFYDSVKPAAFTWGKLRYQNPRALQTLGLSSLSKEDLKNHFFSFNSLPNNLPEPLALRYHGHQFLHYNPDLGDGRGFLFAQIKTDKLYDLGTKGSGTTPYSRRGDGRLTLKGAVREALATEMLTSLGVNTSQTFCFFETNENLERHDEPSPTRAAVLTRMSHSHIRIGTFQRLHFLKQTENIKKLVQYCLKHYYPNILEQSPETHLQLFFNSVCEQLAKTTAQWMTAGFVHGVLNSDNMNITGESFDYGPYRFIPNYDPYFTAAYFDHDGLYSFGRQPQAVAWNLQQLAEALKSASESLNPQEGLDHFSDSFNLELQARILTRLNLKSSYYPSEDSFLLNSKLISALFKFLLDSKAHYEQTFFDLHSGAIEERLKKSPQAELYKGENFEKLLELIDYFEVCDESVIEQKYFAQTSPESLLIDEIEYIWKPIADSDDWSLFEAKIQRLRLMPQLK